MNTDRYIKIREELEELKRMIKDVSSQMQELRESVRGTPVTVEMLPMPEPYVHPWWQYQRTGSISSGNNFRNKSETSTINIDETRSGIPGKEKAA